MSIRSLALVVVAALVITTCYSLPTNNADARAVGGDKVDKPFDYHVQIQYPVKRHVRYCYGTALTAFFIGAPVYDCIDDFKLGDETHTIYKVGTYRNGRGTKASPEWKKYSKLYNVINLARNIGVIKVKGIEFESLPNFMPINFHLKHNNNVDTYGFGSLFSTGNEDLQKAESITVTRLRARTQYPLKVQNYTLGLRVNKNAANTMDIGAPIILKSENKLAGLVVFSDHDKWDFQHYTIILGQEICGDTMGKILEEWTGEMFCKHDT